MKAFARITAVIFIILGVLIILGAVGFVFSGFGQPEKPSAPSIIPDMTGLIVLARVLGGGAIGLQGLFLAALGQGLWLLAGVYEQTQRTSDALSALMRRNSQPKQ
jgi:amino acid transporter